MKPCKLRTCRDCGELLADDTSGELRCLDCREDAEAERMWEATDDEDDEMDADEAE